MEDILEDMTPARDGDQPANTPPTTKQCVVNDVMAGQCVKKMMKQSKKLSAGKKQKEQVVPGQHLFHIPGELMLPLNELKDLSTELKLLHADVRTLEIGRQADCYMAKVK